MVFAASAILSRRRWLRVTGAPALQLERGDASRSNPDLHPLIRKLESIAPVSDDERGAIAALPITVRDLKADADIVRDQDRPSQCCAILEGFACRYKLLPGGRRQIMSFYIPGDIPDLQSLHWRSWIAAWRQWVPARWRSSRMRWFGRSFVRTHASPTCSGETRSLSGGVSGVGRRSWSPRCLRADRAHPVRGLCAPQGRRPGKRPNLRDTDTQAELGEPPAFDRPLQPMQELGETVSSARRRAGASSSKMGRLKRPESSTPHTSTSRSGLGAADCPVRPSGARRGTTTSSVQGSAVRDGSHDR